jgi:hypothetical protein
MCREMHFQKRAIRASGKLQNTTRQIGRVQSLVMLATVYYDVFFACGLYHYATITIPKTFRDQPNVKIPIHTYRVGDKLIKGQVKRCQLINCTASHRWEHQNAILSCLNKEGKCKLKMNNLHWVYKVCAA